MLAGLAAAGVALAWPDRRAWADGAAPRRAPSSYVGHGSPMTALDREKGAPLVRWGEAVARPDAILVVSAHYERAPVTIGATRTRPLVYDFRGFPRELYQVRYPAPGAPALAKDVAKRLAPLGTVYEDPTRGLDHGAWVPLRWMAPQADVPVLLLSLPSHDPKALWRIGRALRPLRDEGVWFLGSGNLTHNLRQIDPRPDAPVVAWASEFDAWATEALRRRDVDALLDWERRAPAARTNHPTVEHLVPLLLAVAASFDDDVVRFPVTGFEHGSLSRRSVSFDAPAPRPKRTTPERS